VPPHDDDDGACIAAEGQGDVTARDAAKDGTDTIAADQPQRCEGGHHVCTVMQFSVYFEFEHYV
jgi:hypothetical protein